MTRIAAGRFPQLRPSQSPATPELRRSRNRKPKLRGRTRPQRRARVQTIRTLTRRRRTRPRRPTRRRRKRRRRLARRRPRRQSPLRPGRMRRRRESSRLSAPTTLAPADAGDTGPPERARLTGGGDSTPASCVLRLSAARRLRGAHRDVVRRPLATVATTARGRAVHARAHNHQDDHASPAARIRSAVIPRSRAGFQRPMGDGSRISPFITHPSRIVCVWG